MSRNNRTGLYLGAAAVGAGAYYLYRAGGNPRAAKEEMKYDATKARSKTPRTEQIERGGQKALHETKLNLDETANNLRTKTEDIASEGMKKLDEIRLEGQEKASQVRNEVEEKASEAKGNVSGWFGGKK